MSELKVLGIDAGITPGEIARFRRVAQLLREVEDRFMRGTSYETGRMAEALTRAEYALFEVVNVASAYLGDPEAERATKNWHKQINDKEAR